MDFSNIDLSWAPPVLAFLSVLGIVAAMIRWLVKTYLDEMKAEFKPNGGSSLKDQVNRLEKAHIDLNKKVDRIMQLLITGRFKMPDTKAIKTIDHQDEEPK